MTNPLAALQQLVAGGQPVAPAGVGNGNDPAQMLKQLMMGGSRGNIPGSNPMQAAIMDRMATAQAGDPLMPQMQGGGRPVNYGAEGTGMMPGMGDQGYLDVAQANQAVRGNLPPQYNGPDYTGASDEVEPMPDPSQMPYSRSAGDVQDDEGGYSNRPEVGTGNQQDDEGGYSNRPENGGYAPNIGARGAPGQSIMGAYLSRNKAARDATQSEIDDIQKRMGGTPEDNGDFPSNAEIKALNSGKISPTEFDKKWGKGAAQEIMDDYDPGDDAAQKERDDGDHEYR